MRRREFVTLLLCSAAAWPLATRAQQKPMPVIGFLGGFNPSMKAQIELEQAAFRRGLAETGYLQGQNVVIEYRRGEGHLDRLPALAADLVARKVDVIVTQGGDSSSLAAKNATSTIPILFHTVSDPVAIGLVASLARPGGNLTGVSMMYAELMPKLLELLLELVPYARVIALLVNPGEAYAERIIGHMQEAARAKRMDIRVLKARTESEIDDAFATLVQMQADGLVFGPIGFRPQIAALASRHAVPAIALQRDFPDVGGLISYGPRLTAVYHLKGIYAGKILKGAKPADLPVQQPTEFDLVINHSMTSSARARIEGGTARPSAFAVFRDAAAIVAAGVDAILVSAKLGRAVQQATRTIPILAIGNDLVRQGFVGSLAHPGGNVTGISILGTELDGKRQALLTRLVPGVRQIAVLADPTVTAPRQLQALQQMARARGVELSICRAAKPGEIGPAIDAAKASGAQALNVLASALFNDPRLIIERTAAVRLPAMYQRPADAEAGGLVAYGARLTEIFRQRARQLVKILRGAKPADIPVEQPAKFELVINLNTAKALGLAVPPLLLAQADEVIE